MEKPELPNRTALYRIVLGTLVLLFITYNCVLYTIGTKTDLQPMSPSAIRGQNLWQQNNCTACHQIYGLGGYLGPDLTNVISLDGKGPQYVKAFLNSGVRAMPVFNFNEEEKDDIVELLKHIDKTGYFPNRNPEIENSGWVKLKYKQQEND